MQWVTEFLLLAWISLYIKQDTWYRDNMKNLAVFAWQSECRGAAVASISHATVCLWMLLGRSAESSHTGGCCEHQVPCKNTSGMLMRTWCHALSRIPLAGSFVGLLSVWRQKKISSAWSKLPHGLCWDKRWLYIPENCDCFYLQSRCPSPCQFIKNVCFAKVGQDAWQG